MEFLVRFETALPAGLGAEERERLRTEERKRAGELRRAGLLVKLWRVPGTRGGIGLWEARDATELHDALASLPTFPWMTATVEPLATHPQEAQLQAARAQEAQVQRTGRPGTDDDPEEESHA
ncbi:muconolactone Delta-isomerase family protein [Intrasporangium sp.]|uniref:muconolactone Delta-isomerase n=1 Tax=Intrasporangium sp. TaxID=1925024 RepID=UPI00293A0E0F|nr:muconolactone Delta-isomerase family protein [Intrasporangium sp.]MDV3223165.1 muconolactone Delta-isomerase family protein [Intrasporangium sp.]